jgi:DNA polymerase-1
VVTVDEPAPGRALPAARRQVVAEDGTPAGPPGPFDPAAPAGAARWVWPDTAETYPGLVRAGVRVERCHDLALTEALLSGYHGHWGEPRGLAAAWARLRGLPVPEDPPHRSDAGQPPAQLALFETGRGPALPGAESELAAAVAVHAEQLRRVAAVASPGRFRLLVAAESAGALAAAELGAVGLPWRADVHDALLTELLGPRPVGPGRPKRLAELADRIAAAFGATAAGPPGHGGEAAGRRGGYRINPDSPADVVRAFARIGVTVPSTRAFVLRTIDHPAVEPLLRYKELSRLHTANGWAFLASWVRDGRFRAEYVAGGVVSGRWATRGGGALQIPKQLRRAVVADPGHLLVVADAGQLEPRVLAALSSDHRMAAAAGSTDLYAALAADAFDGDRGKAKIALLSAMYGGTSGPGGVLLGTLRRRFPVAVDYVEAAARAGEQGKVVRSHLGRTCPPPSAGWFGEAGRTQPGEPGAPDEADDPATAGSRDPGDPAADPGGGRTDAAARARGRFTRNFVVQATAAEWALILLAELRGRLAALPGAELVFFQHDEVIVHCPEELAAEVTTAITECAERAGHLLFGDTEVRFPLDLSAVPCYADAK